MVATPVLIGAASLAGRRWGPAVGGWLVGLPLTSAPIAFFLARDQGLPFAADAAAGIMAGTVSQAAFAIAYAWASTRGHWPLALAAGVGAFVLSTVALQRLPLALTPLAVVAVGALLLCRALMPAVPFVRSSASAPLPWWDIPARMVVTTGFVLLLTAMASRLGSWLTGLITPFPLYAAILVSFTQSLEGPAHAAGVLRGLLLGLFCFAGFFFVLAALLERAGIAPAFLAAAVIALAIQGGALAALRRGYASAS